MSDEKQKKEENKEIEKSKEIMELDDEELEQASGGSLRDVVVNKTKDITDSMKKRI